MPGLQGENVVAALGSPIKRSKLSLKFFQKKETKRALDFSEPPPEESTPSEAADEPVASCDQVVPAPDPCPTPTGPLLPSEKQEVLIPFVGLNNLGNTCYLNSILQVLYYCPGLKEGIKKLSSVSKRQKKPTDQTVQTEEEQAEGTEESLPAPLQLLGSFNSLIASVEQLQSSFLLNPGKYDGELATQPRKLLQTLRQLNPMYEGYLQHDAQEVLQCILGYIQEACNTIRKEQDVQKDSGNSEIIEVKPDTEGKSMAEEEGQTSGKRKSDTEVGNAKKKPKSVTSGRASAEEDNDSKPLTRSKRKSSSDITLEGTSNEKKEEKEVGKKEPLSRGKEGEAEHRVEEKGGEGEEGKRKGKKRAKLGWLKPSGKQPSIFSKFRSIGRMSSVSSAKGPTGANQECGAAEKDQPQHEQSSQEPRVGQTVTEDTGLAKRQDCSGLDMMERLFQGQLVLRTRCLECESYTERREDFQDISVPVQEDLPCSPDGLSEVSPDPKPELKTLKWAISQFASVERIVGEDKYFCETCHHYTEAERSLLFDKTPEVVTIHLKCFSATGLELDPYAGLSKVNTPLQTPLTLSLDEWCTHPSANRGQHYQLFAVVMHSGVTISSGHYTTYIRMSDLGDTRLWREDPEKGDEDQMKEEAEEKEESRDTPVSTEDALDYDDGEVSFSLGRKRRGGVKAGSPAVTNNGNKTGAKKTSEGLGLLGGQRSLPSHEQPSGAAAEGPKRLHAISSPGSNTMAGLKEPGVEAASRLQATEEEKGCKRDKEGERFILDQQALSSLQAYEGKWLLFDDSEVHMCEEEDFLRACSPETCSTSTPYLLFYRRVPQPKALT